MANDEGTGRRNAGIAAGAAALLVVLLVTLWTTGVFNRAGNGPGPVDPPIVAVKKDLQAELEKILKDKNPKMDPDLQKKWELTMVKSKELQQQVDKAQKEFETRIADYKKKEEEAKKKGEDDLAKKLEAMRKTNEDGLKWMKEKYEEDAKELLARAEKGLPPPNTLALQTPPQLTDSEAGDETTRTLLTAAAAALCIVQPELCWVGALLEVGLTIFGSTEQRQALNHMVSDIIAGRPVSPDDLKSFVAATVKSNKGRAAQPFLEPLVNMLPEDWRPKGPGIVAPINNPLDDENKASEGPPLKALRELIETKPDDSQKVLEALPKVGGERVFESSEQKSRAQIMCYRQLKDGSTPYVRYWTEVLRNVKVNKR